jgi:two-component system heavy metal sensor histidine kinase CusS
MRTLGARLAVGYAVLSTLTLFSLLAVGYHLLNGHVSGGLDLLNQAEAERVKTSLRALPEPPSPGQLVEQLRTFAPAESALFLLELSDPEGQVLFRSPNLGAHSLRAEGAANTDLRLPGLGPLRVGTHALPGGILRIGTSAAEAREMMNTYTGMSILLVCVILIASLITGVLLSQAALRPVRAIQETANQIHSDNLSRRIPVPDSVDEISSLAQLLNEMFDRLESSFDQIRRFTAETSHELKTPLSLIRLHTEKLLTEDSALTPSQQERLQTVLEEEKHLCRIIENLLFLSRAEVQAITPELRRQDPRRFLEDFAEDAQTLTEHSNLTFKMIISGSGEVDLDVRLLRQVLLNLIGNAVAASPPGGLITVESDFTLDAWCLAVEDDGTGVPEGDRERIFERFVRLKPEGAPAKGSGLGLTICRSLMTLHRGTIRAEAGLRRGGLRVVGEIPVATVAAPPRSYRPEKDLITA